ncbi:hypothetical protein L596_013650 [Steinernema carpocapsae]|uniref:TIL domain-containing protein n=1 Tax=Steinernema carpocapsae TaxID=34508 RepID=A0A4U5P0T3_STECR|nr:hypothetical protein L596_013650 [Steinernema carpocapsae]
MCTGAAKNKCGPNEYWNPNATCDDTCAHPDAHLCLIIGHPACTCIKGYVKDVEGGKCIPLKDCPKRCPLTTVKPSNNESISE